MKYYLFSTALLLLHLTFGESIQSVAVKGVLLCGKNGAENVLILLHRSKNLDPKQIIERQATGPSGVFQINGNTKFRVGNDSIIDSPTIAFYHNCKDDPKNKKKIGYRELKLTIPQSFVSLGSKTTKVYDIGTLNLEAKYINEKRVKNLKS